MPYLNVDACCYIFQDCRHKHLFSIYGKCTDLASLHEETSVVITNRHKRGGERGDGGISSISLSRQMSCISTSLFKKVEFSCLSSDCF